MCELSAADRYLVALPAAHNFPLACPGILGTLAVGGRVIMCPSPSPETAFDCMEKTDATVTALVPPLVKVWLEHAERVRPAPASLRLLQVGGARLEAGIARRVPSGLGCQLQQVFGMAEGLLNFTRPIDPAFLVYSTQGRPLSSLDEIKIVDEQGHEVPRGTLGELCTRGPYTLRGYYKNEEANRRSFTDDGFYRSGDLVRQLSTGHLVVEGRKREVIRRGAETVSIDVLETLLADHKAIRDVAVVGPAPASGWASKYAPRWYWRIKMRPHPRWRNCESFSVRPASPVLCCPTPWPSSKRCPLRSSVKLHANSWFATYNKPANQPIPKRSLCHERTRNPLTNYNPSLAGRRIRSRQ